MVPTDDLLLQLLLLVVVASKIIRLLWDPLLRKYGGYFRGYISSSIASTSDCDPHNSLSLLRRRANTQNVS